MSATLIYLFLSNLCMLLNSTRTSKLQKQFCVKCFVNQTTCRSLLSQQTNKGPGSRTETPEKGVKYA